MGKVIDKLTSPVHNPVNYPPPYEPQFFSFISTCAFTAADNFPVI